MGYTTEKLSTLLTENAYPGRGIVVGLSEDGKNAVFCYFIMGRSENSRNRVFRKTEDGVIIYPFDESKVTDPSLIIYSPVRKAGKKTVVTNGDQTDTVIDFLLAGKTVERALETRAFEPDAPNFTPRISAVLDFEKGYSYKMNILKSADAEGSGCNRFTYSYFPVKGVGHFLHTYEKDGTPLPTFSGEPERVALGNDIDRLSEEVWNSLNKDNKIALYVSFTDLSSGKEETRLFNRFE